MAMSIKDHIEAGHYERDSKGRALVPHREHGTIVICATDMPGTCPILGFRIDGSGNRTTSSGADSGFGYFADSSALLPPPPRKVKVTRWGVVRREDDCHMTTFAKQHEATTCYPAALFIVYPLTGEYEEPWSS